MASAAHKAWVSAGKPLTPCQPIRDYVARLKAAFPRAAAANLFSWYANDAHYMAVPPEDHTPFSATGWPVASPRWFVFATDVMHRPDLGVDCNALFAYWLAEARAGRTPWVKYIIWHAQLYDVRNQWKPVNNSGHHDHIHISVRTDHQGTTLGAWSLVPGQGDDMTPEQDRLLRNVERILTTGWTGRPAFGISFTPGVEEPAMSNPFVVLGDAVKAVGNAPVAVDATAVAAALAANKEFLAAIAKAVADEDHRRSQE